MLHALGGGSGKNPSDYYGREVTAASFSESGLRLEFSDGAKVKLWDDGQSCCESRYMVCEDDTNDLVGGKLVGIEVSDGPDFPEGEYGESHEAMFLKVATDKASITVATHVEHSGYYGGFGLTLSEEKSAS